MSSQPRHRSQTVRLVPRRGFWIFTFTPKPEHRRATFRA